MGYELTEEEARIVLGWADVASLERGLGRDENVLFGRIRRTFPKIDSEMSKEALYDHLWSVVVEKDPRVKAVRDRMPEFLNQGEKKFTEYIRELDETKRKVLEEIEVSSTEGRK